MYRRGTALSFVMMVSIILVACGLFYLTNNPSEFISFSPGDDGDVPSMQASDQTCGPGSTCGAPGKPCTTPQGSGICQGGSGDPCICVVQPPQEVTHLECLFSNCSNSTYVSYTILSNSTGIFNITNTTINSTCFSSCVEASGPGMDQCPLVGSTCATNSSSYSYVNQSFCTWQFGPEIRLTTDTGHSGSPSAAFDSQGNVHLVWEDYLYNVTLSQIMGRTGKIYYMKLSGSGAILRPKTFIYDVNGTTSFQNSYVRVLVDDLDRVHLIWKRLNYMQILGDKEIYHARLTSNGDISVAPHIVLSSLNKTFSSFQTKLRVATYQNNLYILLPRHSGSFTSSQINIDLLKLDDSGNLVNDVTIYNRTDYAMRYLPGLFIDSSGLMYSSFVNLSYSPSLNSSAIYIPLSNAGSPLAQPKKVLNFGDKWSDGIKVLKTSSKLHFIGCLVNFNDNPLYESSLPGLLTYVRADLMGNRLSSQVNSLNDCVQSTSLYHNGGDDAAIDKWDNVHLAYTSIDSSVVSPFNQSAKSQIHYIPIINNSLSPLGTDIQVSNSQSNSRASNPSIVVKDRVIFFAWQDGRHHPPLQTGGGGNYEIYGRYYTCI